MTKISNQLISKGWKTMQAANLTKKKLGCINSICGGARGLSGTDLQGGAGLVMYGVGRVLRWVGL